MEETEETETGQKRQNGDVKVGGGGTLPHSGWGVNEEGVS